MSEAATPLQRVEHAPVNAIVAMIRVADVERSAEFYRLLGFEIGNYVPRPLPPDCAMHWAWLYQPNAPNWKTGANLMLVRGVGGFECDPDTHVVLYLYAADLAALRERLLQANIKAGKIEYPEYLPKGEFQTHDPDGYTVMIAQSYEQSP